MNEFEAVVYNHVYRIRKVFRKIQRIGNQLITKLKQKYEGPYKIVKVQPNTVSYVIHKIEEPNPKDIKVHYKQIKEYPRYLRHLIQFEPLQTENNDVDDYRINTAFSPPMYSNLLSSDPDSSNRQFRQFKPEFVKR